MDVSGLILFFKKLRLREVCSPVICVLRGWPDMLMGPTGEGHGNERWWQCSLWGDFGRITFSWNLRWVVSFVGRYCRILCVFKLRAGSPSDVFDFSYVFGKKGFLTFSSGCFYEKSKTLIQKGPLLWPSLSLSLFLSPPFFLW